MFHIKPLIIIFFSFVIATSAFPKKQFSKILDAIENNPSDYRVTKLQKNIVRKTLNGNFHFQISLNPSEKEAILDMSQGIGGRVKERSKNEKIYMRCVSLFSFFEKQEQEILRAKKEKELAYIDATLDEIKNNPLLFFTIKEGSVVNNILEIIYKKENENEWFYTEVKINKECKTITLVKQKHGVGTVKVFFEDQSVYDQCVAAVNLIEAEEEKASLKKFELALTLVKQRQNDWRAQKKHPKAIIQKKPSEDWLYVKVFIYDSPKELLLNMKKPNDSEQIIEKTTNSDFHKEFTTIFNDLVISEEKRRQIEYEEKRQAKIKYELDQINEVFADIKKKPHSYGVDGCLLFKAENNDDLYYVRITFDDRRKNIKLRRGRRGENSVLVLVYEDEGVYKKCVDMFHEIQGVERREKIKNALAHVRRNVPFFHSSKTSPNNYQISDEAVLNITPLIISFNGQENEIIFSKTKRGTKTVVREIINSQSSLHTNYMDTFKLLENLEHKKKRIAAEDEARRKNSILMFEKEMAARIEKTDLEKLVERCKLEEIETMERACRKAGYKGLVKYEGHPLDLIRFVYVTQKEGGLENYLNHVLWDRYRSQEERFRETKAIQVLPNGILYSYIYYDSEETFTMLAYVEKDPKKMHQEGESLENTLYVFNGIFNYTTITGARKSVPSFHRAKMELP